jgi:hypothetical protein
MPPKAITTLRTTIATALANPGVWSTFAYPAPVLLANSVSVIPADPYITPTNNDYATISPLANFKILMAVPAFDNQGNLAGMEDFIVAVFNKLASSTLAFNVSTVSAPAILSASSGDLLTAEIQISTLTTWS